LRHRIGAKVSERGIIDVFERYSEESRQALFVARAAALTMHESSIDVQHLVAGTLATWPPAKSCREDVVRSLGVMVPQELNIVGDIPFSAAAQRVLRRTMTRADQLGHHRIRPEHLLLALIEEPGLDEALRQAGIRREVVIEGATAAAFVDDSPIPEPTAIKWRDE
jgi:ATP-dependent Clp protease ATP-binding subunit ClpA